MRTACLVVFASLFLVRLGIGQAVELASDYAGEWIARFALNLLVGSALAQKECDDELGDTVLPTARPLPGEHAARGAVSSGRHLESHQRRSPR